MNLNLGKTVIDFLKARPEEKFTARQIAEWIFSTFPDECQEKKDNSQVLSTDIQLLQQLAAEIGSKRLYLQKKCLALKTTEGRPRKYYYSEKSDSAEVVSAENIQFTQAKGTNSSKFGEHRLYSLLSVYL